MKIRALIVDDEQHAREGIQLRLKEFPNISIVGECSSGEEALVAINTLKPDLVFLDIQMPEMSGFEVLQKMTLSQPPMIIFVTAYDRYAVRAFEFHALDYLLKPINDNRFRETLHRVTTEMKHRKLEQYSQQLKILIDEYTTLNEEVSGAENEQISAGSLTRILVKVKDHISVLPVEDIDWIESAGDYVYVHSKNQKYLVRETLSSLENNLDASQFVRIHRSTIVNIKQVRSFRSTDSGDYDVFLTDGTQLKLSRNYRLRFQQFLQHTP